VNHSVESGVPPKSRFGGQEATPRPDSEYDECDQRTKEVQKKQSSFQQSALVLLAVKSHALQVTAVR